MSSEVDLLIVFHDSRQWIPGLFASLRQVSIPITAYFLDNASTDGTPDLLADEVQSLPFRAYVLRSIQNNGFGGGINLLTVQSRAEMVGSAVSSLSFPSAVKTAAATSGSLAEALSVWSSAGTTIFL